MWKMSGPCSRSGKFGFSADNLRRQARPTFYIDVATAVVAIPLTVTRLGQETQPRYFLHSHFRTHLPTCLRPPQHRYLLRHGLTSPYPMHRCHFTRYCSSKGPIDAAKCLRTTRSISLTSELLIGTDRRNLSYPV